MSNFKIGIPFILLITFSFVLFVGGTIPYFIFYIFLMTITIPFLHSLITLRKLNGTVNIPQGSLYTGEKIDIDYEVNNATSFTIPYLQIQSDISKQLSGVDSPNVILSLGKKESFTRRETVILKRRGYYEIGDIEIKISDVFGLYSFKKKLSSSISLLVYPEAIKLSTFKVVASQQLGDLSVHDLAFQDKSRVASLRDYIEGDSVKLIHWKQSSKRENPIVKEFENRGDINTLIFIDNESKHFKSDINRRMEDKVADAALSIINYCLNQNIQVNLKVQNNLSITEIQGQQSSDMKPFLETLACFKGNGAISFTALLMSRIESIKKSSTVIIITSNLDKEMGAHGIHLKMKNMNPLFISVTDRVNKNGTLDLEVEKRMREEGITVYALDCDTSIKEALEGRHE